MAARTNMGQGRSEELVAVAARLFRDRGYDATTMQEIADEMGILKGSLYHYVTTKEDLLWMIVEGPLEELVANATTIFSDASLNVPERLHRAIRAHAESFEHHYPHMFVITRENGETLSADRRKTFDALRNRYSGLWKKAIDEGIRSGELRPDLDPTLTVNAILGVLNWMFRWFKPGGRLSAGDVADHFTTILASGLLATTPRVRRGG